MITRTYDISPNFEPVIFVSLKQQYSHSTKETPKRLRLSSSNFQKLTTLIKGAKIYDMKLQEDASLDDSKAVLDNVAS